MAEGYDIAMGYYYEEPPQREDKPPGCMEGLLIIRVTLGIVALPVAAMILLLVDIMAMFALFAIHPALALIPLAASIAGIWLFARWERGRTLPPE